MFTRLKKMEIMAEIEKFFEAMKDELCELKKCFETEIEENVAQKRKTLEKLIVKIPVTQETRDQIMDGMKKFFEAMRDELY